MFEHPNPLETIINILRLDVKLFTKVDRGKLGYKDQMICNNISILYNGNTNMGIHIILTGKGCRHYEMYHSLLELIYNIDKNKGKLTRIDLALDDFIGDTIPISKLKRDIITGNITSKWKTSTEIIKRDMTGTKLGDTISLGSRTSNAFLRIYDKALEQNLDITWHRLEIEIRKSNAENLQKKIKKDNVGQLMKGILNNYIRILTPNKRDKNKSRWKTASYWDKLIDNASKISLSNRPEEKTIDNKKDWVDRQVGQSLALITKHDGNTDFINSVLEKHTKGLKEKHRILLEQLRGNNKDVE